MSPGNNEVIAIEWVVLFIVSWAVFLFHVDWRTFKYNMFAGIFSVCLQLIVDTHSIHHKFYMISDQVINLWGSSIFFILGPIFTVGTLMAQYHPAKWWMRVFNVLVLSALYSIQEALLLKDQVLVYTNWHYFDSVLVNTFAMIIISWFIMVVIERKEVVS